MGKPVETVPQVFIDQQHIGGCTDFEAYAKTHLQLFDKSK
ncbi:glutaredoxin-1, putative [Edwardsiella ictaluri 93-146]|uniref:Glutaredoxin-1, putative n=1 Tax=Edwardsiella ictaluri (strain 93-146) TaxID=634503 RepID=C5BED7_EDWI9|nr:glutaredoxin-1, putative [Edwardsiella ictaluri 93-146]